MNKYRIAAVESILKEYSDESYAFKDRVDKLEDQKREEARERARKKVSGIRRVSTEEYRKIQLVAKKLRKERNAALHLLKKSGVRVCDIARAVDLSGTTVESTWWRVQRDIERTEKRKLLKETG